MQHRTMKFATISHGFRRMEWLDRNLCHVTGCDDHVTKCTHSRVVGIRLEGILVARKKAPSDIEFICQGVTQIQKERYVG